MRACVVALVVAMLALGPGAPAGLRAQTAPQAEAARSLDVAEQLATLVPQWFEALAAQGKVPTLYTGITADARHLILELDGLPIDADKRRDFMIWLSQRYRVVAYAHAGRFVTPDAASGRPPEEALNIFAGSAAKDVFVRFAITRQAGGAIKYEREAYRADSARGAPDHPLLGLSRLRQPPAGSEEFAKVWPTLENRIFWRGVTTGSNRPATDESSQLTTRALELHAAGDCEASLRAAGKATEMLRQQGGTQSAAFARALVVQGLCHKQLANVAEAERLYRQAIDIYEKVAGANSRDLGIALDNLGGLYAEHGRRADAERLRLRALEIFKTTLDPGSREIAISLQNLGSLYLTDGRFAEAEAKFVEALPLVEKALGADSREVAVLSDNLAGVYRSQRRLDEAETHYLRALAIFRKTLGPEHPETVLALQNHAILLGETRRPAEAEAALKEAVTFTERLYGPGHHHIASALNTLVVLMIEQQRWQEALEPARRAAAISVQLADRGKVEPPSEGGQRASSFRRLVQAAYGAGPADPRLMDEAFIAAQRALDTNAALALVQLAARHAAGDGALAALLRERQDLAAELEEHDKKLVAAAARPPTRRDPAGEAGLRTRMGAIDGRLAEIDRSLAQSFPQFAALAKPQPLSVARAQALLEPNEALLQYIDLQPIGDVPEMGFAWLVTKDRAEWVRLPLGTHGLATAVAKLRCGLDAKPWSQGRFCQDLLKREVGESESLPFDLEAAHQLYQALIGPFEARIRGKQLLVVPTGALTGLPLSVLVTAKPAEAFPASPEGYRRAAWLGASQPVTMLPSVGSLQALRQFAKAGKATRAYLGVGNPLLDGPQDDARHADHYKQQAALARDKQQCPKLPEKSLVQRIAGLPLAGYASLFRGGHANADSLRQWTPLPETADELCDVGRRLGASDGDILLGGNATEAALKQLSEDGRLAEYSILHFATHGALTGDVKGLAEPGLLLTPPRKGTVDATSLARDDGFLSASEIAALKLDADWVVLSACNTAGSSGETAEALSGMARAFFYAGARALLVSHWEVGSEAAVKLVTHAFAELKSRKGMARSEAMRLAMRAMIEKGAPAEAHPSQWAPFTVAGEGSMPVQLANLGALTALPAAAPTPTPAPATAPVKAKSGSPPGKSRAAPPNWKNEIWRQ